MLVLLKNSSASTSKRLFTARLGLFMQMQFFRFDRSVSHYTLSPRSFVNTAR